MEFGNIGVFLCSCGKTLNLDLRKIARELGKLEEVAVVERVERLCTEEGLAYIVDDLRRKELDKIVVGACTTKNSLFEGVADEWGLDPLGVEIVNIREECAWVHEDGKAATQKAKVLLKSAVKRQPKLPEIVEVSVKPSILIAGDIRAVELAQGFSDLDDVEIHLLTEDPYFRRAQVESSTHAPAVKGSFYEFHEAAFHTNAKITAVKGDLGDFTVDIERGRYIDVARCVDCGRCIEVCEAKAISKAEDSTTPAYVIDERCTLCGECVKVCPTEAIFLEPEDETLSVGQIISFYPLRPQEGVYVIDEKGWAEASRRAALQAALNMRGYKKERFISSDTERCANRHLMEKKLDIKGCTYCEESCAYYPVRSGFISDLSCRGCGSCASSCPQGTYNLDFQPFEGLLGDVELTAEADLKPRIVMFTCSEGGYSTLRAAGQKGLTYPAAIPIIVPCLGNVSELHILRALDMGAEGVILLGCGAGSCMYGRGFSRGSRSAAMARSVLDFFGLGKERVRMLSGDGTDPEAFARQMKDFEERLKGLGKSALRKKRPADLTAIDIKEGGKRALFHTLIAGFAEKTGVREGRLEGELPVGFVTVDEKECTLCGSCAFHCGTGALRHEGDEVIDIYYNHSLCIGCGLCQEICPEKVIKMERVLDLKPFLEREERKFEVPIISCSQCGKPIMAEAAMRKLKGRLKERGLEMLDMCQSCTDRVTVADLVGAKPDEITIFQQGKAPWDS